LQKLKVDIRLGVEFRVEEVNAIRPDAVILAMGSTPDIPPIPGIDGKNVVTAEEVLLGCKVGERVIIIGGEIVGCETADFLANQGKKVTIMRRGKKMATHLGVVVRALLLRRLREKGVEMITGIRVYDGITEEGLLFIDEDGTSESREADTIVLACGVLPNDKLLQQLRGRVAQVHLVGDCLEPRNLMSAIHEGAAVARQI